MSEHPVTPPSHPPLSPPGLPPKEPEANTQRPKLIIGLVFISLLILAVIVIFVLPGSEPPQTAVQLPPATVMESSSPSQDTDTEPPNLAIQQEAESLEQQWFAEKARAELDNMPQWGAKDYQAAMALAQEGHKLLASGDFASAIFSFKAAFEHIFELDNSKELIMQDALSDGQKALDKFIADEATQKFTLALAIDPTNETALLGVQRAASINQVATMMQDVEKFIATGNLAQAHQTLQAISIIDPQFTEAQQLLQDTEKRLQRRAFDQAIGQAIVAFARQDFSRSHKYLQEAERLIPEDRALREFKQRLQEAEKTSILHKLLAQANKHSSEEEWAAAIELYKQAQIIAPLTVASNDGLALAEQRLALENSLKKIIRQTDRLNETAPLQDARQTLRQAQAINNPGSRLQALIGETATVIDQATQPITITFTSDNQTEVTILRIARLGKFFTKKILLKPGHYTLTGSRSGYRDTRKEIQVQQTSRSKSFTILCEEQI